MKIFFAFCLLIAAASHAPYAHAFFPISLSQEDRASLNQATASFNDAAESIKTLATHIKPENITRMVTQIGIVCTATSTAMLAAYAIFLSIKYEFSRQPDAQQERKKVSWKSRTALGLGITLFGTSILGLIKSGPIAAYAAHA